MCGGEGGSVPHGEAPKNPIPKLCDDRDESSAPAPKPTACFVQPELLVGAACGGMLALCCAAQDALLLVPPQLKLLILVLS